MKIKVTALKLFRLIKSLKKEEKRYFKMQISEKRDVQYLSLFDYLDKIDDLNKKHYKQTFSTVKRLSAMQTYLYSQIIDSIEQQHRNSTILLQIQHGIIQIELLYQHELLEEAQELIDNLLELAIESEFFAEAQRLFIWWYHIQNKHFRYAGVSKEKIQTYKDSGQSNTAKLIEHHELLKELSEIFYQASYSLPRSHQKEWQAILQKNKQRERETFLSYQSTVLFLQSSALISGIYLDNDTTRINFLQIIKLLDQAPRPIFERYKRNYIAATLSILINLPGTESMLFHELHTQLQAVDKKKLTTQEKIFWDMAWHQFLVKEHKLEEAIAFTKTMDVQQPLFANYYKNHFHLNTAIAYFGLHRYDPATKLLDSIINNKANHITANLSTAYLLKAIIFYEEKAYNLLPHLVRNMQLVMKKTGVLFKFESLVLNFLKRISKLPNTAHRAAFIKFKVRYQEHFEQLAEEEKEFLKLFNYEGWLNYHIDGTAFQRLIL